MKKQEFSFGPEAVDRWGSPEHLEWEAKRDPHGRRFRKPEVISDEFHAHLMRKFRGEPEPKRLNSR